MFCSIKMANISPFRCPKILFGPFRWLKSFSVFSRTDIILLSICTSRIPCSTYKLKLHTSKQGTTSNMQSMTEASRERIQASHHVASCHDPEDVNHGRIQYHSHFYFDMTKEGKMVTRTRVRVTRKENTCNSKTYALKALNCLYKRQTSSNKLRKYAN